MYAQDPQRQIARRGGAARGLAPRLAGHRPGGRIRIRTRTAALKNRTRESWRRERHQSGGGRSLLLDHDKLAEITHCRAAMLGFAGMVTQSALGDGIPFPYGAFIPGQ